MHTIYHLKRFEEDLDEEGEGSWVDVGYFATQELVDTIIKNNPLINISKITRVIFETEDEYALHDKCYKSDTIGTQVRRQRALAKLTEEEQQLLGLAVR